MQSQDQNSRIEDALNHPSPAEWMAFHYGELAPERKRELRAHLAQCPACRERNTAWAKSIVALNEWNLPEPRSATRAWWQQPMPTVRWAAAAAVVLVVAFALGRQNSSAAGEIAALKSSVSQLSQKVDQQRTTAVKEEMTQLLADYSALNEEQRTKDRQAVALALREMETRIVKLRTELETVAVNTESGFRQTQEGLTELASIAANDRVPEVSNPDSKNR